MNDDEIKRLFEGLGRPDAAISILMRNDTVERTITCVGYVRNSQPGANVRPESTDRQKEVYKAYANDMGWQDLGFFTDVDKTGFRLKRPGMDALRAFVKANKVDKVYVADATRFSRSTLHALKVCAEFAERGTTLHILRYGDVDQSTCGTIFAPVGASQAYTTLAAKLQLKSMIRSGRWVGPPAYGYRLTPGKPGILTIDPEEAETVKSVFDMALRWMNTKAIARELNRRGSRTAHGNVWTGSVILHMLRREIYAGVLIYGRNEVVHGEDRDTRREVMDPSTWTYGINEDFAIIDRPTFAAAQKILGVVKRRRRRDPARKCLTTRKAFCADCGSMMFASGNPATRYRYLYCPLGASGSGECKQESFVRCDMIDETIVEGAVRLLETPEAEMAVIAAAKTADAEARPHEAARLAAAERALAKTRREIGNVVLAVSKGLLTNEDVCETLAEMRDVQSVQNAEVAAARNSVEALDEALIPSQRIVTATGNLRQLFAANDNEGSMSPDLCEALREMFERIVVRQTEDSYQIQVEGHLAVEAVIARRKPGRPRLR